MPGPPGFRQNTTPNSWRLLLRALGHRNYRLFFFGQGISLIGSWMTRVATAWLVYRLTHSPWLLGLVAFASQVPSLVLGPFAGVWVDRFNRHRILVVTQILLMAQALGLAALALSGVITIPDVFALSLVQGAVNAFDMPARHSFVVQMVEKREDLGNAIAMNSSLVNAARLIGPSIAGFVIAALGEGYCFLIDGISYVAVIASLLAMRVNAQVTRQRRGVLTELHEGFRYAAGFSPIRSVLLLLALVSLVGMPYAVLMPMFAGQILHGGPHTLGFLMAASGLGALVGALLLAARPSVLGLGRVITRSAAIFGLALIGFSLSRQLWLSLPILFVAGFGLMQQMAGSNTILQTIVEDEKRGRVMSLYATAFQGVAPFGSLGAGAAANRFGAPLTLAMGGTACLIAAGIFALHLPALRRAVRPIYRRMGILPEVTSGIESASDLQRPPEQ